MNDKNYMEEVAKLFGVELDKEFELIYKYDPTFYATVKLTLNGVVVIKTNVCDTLTFKNKVLEWLLVGDYDIKRKPWKPKFNEKYYSVGVDGSTEEGTWLSDFLDYTLYKIGNCYRTAEEARANRIKWGTFYDSEEVLNV